MATVCSPPHLIPSRSARSVGAARAHLRLVGDDWAQARPLRPGPAVHVIAPVTAATYRRRRIMALLAVIAITAGVQVGALAMTQQLWGSRAVSPAATSASTASAASATSANVSGAPSGSVSPEMVPARATGQKVYVVRPGDSLWTIAQRLQPSGDVRPLIDELTRRAGSSSLQTGQRIDLDGLRF